MATKNINAHLSLLGKKAKDRISGREGIVDSICFDLYGYIQVSLNSGLDKDGEPRKGYWHDVSRIEVLDETPVMEQPDWYSSNSAVARGEHGPAEKAVRVDEEC